MKQVETLKQLKRLAEKKRAVIVPKSWPWHKPHPAAVVLNLSGEILCRLFALGMYVYESPVKGGAE